MNSSIANQFGYYPRHVVHDVGGDELIERFRNKMLGGRRNKNGRAFEIAYGVHVVICEMAALVEGVTKGMSPDCLRDRFFSEQPIAMMDDLYIYGLAEHFFAQLKSGEFTISEIADELAVQIELDDAINFNVSYKAVLGKYTITNGTIADIEAFARTTVETFAYSRNYLDNVALNEALYDAMRTLTGHLDITAQQVAYRSFFSLFWECDGESGLADFLDRGAADRETYIRPFELATHLDALRGSIEAKARGVSAVIVGQLLRLSFDGILQTFDLPSDSDFHGFQTWLEARQDLTFRQVVAGLEKSGWKKIAT